ncbi:MAG: protease complex subunit PrcB family protein [Vicinamibacterales bacterium]
MTAVLRTLSFAALFLALQTGASSLPIREIARGDVSNIDRHTERLLRSSTEWTALWREHDFDHPAPPVDFSQEMVVAVFLGSQPTAGYAVRVTDVEGGAEEVGIRYRVTRPAAGDLTAQVLTFPYHIVAVPLRPGTPRFERVN